MFDRFTTGAQKVTVLSQEVARTRRSPTIGPDHMALALLMMADDPGVAPIVRALGLAPAEVQAAIEAGLQTGTHETAAAIPFDGESKLVFQRAATVAHDLGHRHIGTEHLLLAVVAELDTASARELIRAGADRDAILAAIRGQAEPGFQVKTTRGLGRFRKTGRSDEPGEPGG